VDVDFVGLAQDCRGAEAFEARVLEEVGRTIGFDAAFFLTRGNEHAATIVGLDARTAGVARERGGVYAQELLPVKRAALEARGVAVDTAVRGVSAVRRSHYHREIAATVGGDHTLVAYLRFRGQVVAGMMLGRGGRGFSASEVRLVESWLPALAVARAAHGLPWVPAALVGAPPSLLGAITGATGSRVLETVRTAWGSISVRDRAGFREMVAREENGELIWSRVSLSDPRRSGWPYVELLALAPVLARARRRVLCVGCGGASVVFQLASLFPGIAIDVVERAPEVIRLARRWFDLDAIPGVTVHIADGAAFLRAAPPASWDIIVLDAYDASIVASGGAPPELFGSARRSLRAGGALACNVIGTLREYGPVASAVAAARSVFEDVRILPVVDPDEVFSPDSLRNVVVVAAKSP
jgi:spermidine synthase